MLDEREEYIFRLLEARYGDVTACTFRGGIEVLDHTNDDRIHQSAHSLREVLSMILVYDQKNANKNTSGKGENSKTKGYGSALAHATSSRLIESPEDSLFKGLNDTIKNLHSIAHHSQRTLNHEYKALVDRYETLLEDFLKLDFDSLDEVKLLMDMTNPTKADFKRLKILLSKNTTIYSLEHKFLTLPQASISVDVSKKGVENLCSQLYAHFFHNAGSNWLGRLAAEGYIPPSLAPGAHLVTACRAQSAYLARHTAKNPGLVAKLFASLLELGGTGTDPAVQLRAVRAALSMPPDSALPIARQMRPRRGIGLFSRSFPAVETADLVVRLAQSGHVDDAVSLARALLSVRHRIRFGSILPGDIVNVTGFVEPDITAYFFSQAIKTVAPSLFRIAPRQAARLLAKLLARIIRLENMTRPDKERDTDLSMSWRPAMEDHPQNHPPDFKSDLAGMLASRLVETGKRSIPDLKDALREIAAKRYPVFRRLELHVYRHFPGHFGAQIDAAIGACFGVPHVRHEYYHLLNSCFHSLSERARKKYLDMVLAGPGTVYMEQARAMEQAGRGPPAEESVRHWKVRHLAPARDRLDKEERDLVGDLARAPEPYHPDFVAWHEPVRIGVMDTHLKEDMTPDEVIDALRSYAPQKRHAEDVDDTPYALQDRCKSKPRDYSLRSARLAGLHPDLLSAFLRGMRDALAKDDDANISWADVLHLCKSAIESVKNGQIEHNDAVHVADAVSFLLYSALGKDRIDYPLREDIWKVANGTAILTLDDGPRARDAGTSEPDHDSMTDLINTPGGMAFLAAGGYAAWCSRHSDTKPYFAPEARQLFESYLGDSSLHTPPKHAAVGHMLPLFYWYDREWIRGRLHQVFRSGTGALADAAWTGYMDNDPDPDLFGDMIHMYGAAVSSPRRPPSDRADDFMTYSGQLVNHVTQGHLLRMGEDTDGIFDTMVEKSNKNVKSHCAWVVYLVLKAHRESPLESLDPGRFRAIWSGNRLAPNEFLAEWVEFSPLDPGETLGLLHETLKLHDSTLGLPPMMLIRKLPRFLDKHPSMLLACLEEVALGEALRGEFAHADDVLPGMLEALLAADDTHDRTVALVNRLGEMGHNEYGKLLGGERRE